MYAMEGCSYDGLDKRNRYEHGDKVMMPNGEICEVLAGPRFWGTFIEVLRPSGDGYLIPAEDLLPYRHHEVKIAVVV